MHANIICEKRILIVTRELVPFRYGGIGTQFKSLAAFLIRRGHHVAFLSQRPEYFNETLYRDHYGDTSLHFVDVPPGRTGPPQPLVYAAEVARRFDEIYPVVRPDLVILAEFNAEGLFLLMRAAAGAYGETQFLLTINGMNREIIAAHEGDRPTSSPSLMDLPETQSLLAMEDLCVQLAPTIVSPSLCVWEEIGRRLGIARPARIIPNLVDPVLFRPDEEKNRDLAGEPLILFVGKLDRIKGADLLLRAFFEIVREYPDAIPRLVFIGKDCWWDEYGSTFLGYWQGKIPERYAGSVSFLGQVSHDAIRDHLSKATVAVFPSRWEAFGIVCLEALSMGCPVVVSRGTGLEEVLGPELSEFAVPVTGDIEPLARKILSLLKSGRDESRVLGDGSQGPDLSKRLRNRAWEVVRQAEAGWTNLLDGLDRKDRTKSPFDGSICGSLERLLGSLEEQWRGHCYIQIYFRRQGHYSERDSLRRPYSRFRWLTLKLSLPSGTGESPLRLDPSDRPGVIRIREIVLSDEKGGQLWRADGTNAFKGCRVAAGAIGTRREDCLVIEARNEDPQILIVCPVTDRPLEMHVTLLSGED